MNHVVVVYFVYSSQGAWLHLASSQACHLSRKKQIYQLTIMGLKSPAGGRETSWLFPSMTDELNFQETALAKCQKGT